MRNLTYGQEERVGTRGWGERPSRGRRGVRGAVGRQERRSVVHERAECGGGGLQPSCEAGLGPQLSGELLGCEQRRVVVTPGKGKGQGAWPQQGGDSGHGDHHSDSRNTRSRRDYTGAGMP